VGYDELVVVEVGVEAVNQEASFFEAFTLVRGFLIGKIGMDMAEKHG